MAKTSRPARIPCRLLVALADALLAIAGAHAQTYSVLHPFQNFPNGEWPAAPVYRDAVGNLYGTTYNGGPDNAGVVFKLDPGGNLTVLHTFTGGTDGGIPTAGVVKDSAGSLYGTTSAGGVAGSGEQGFGAGVVYKIDASGQFTVLYSFTGGTDGNEPLAGVILDAAGNLYGTTFFGGTPYCGVVYKLSPSGQETVLHSFTYGDGCYPSAGVTADSAGNLYGTTTEGGTRGFGLVYKLSPAGHETVLFGFDYSPTSGVILDGEGSLYGTTAFGVFRLDSAGQLTLLAQLENTLGLSGLARDASGNLYFATNSLRTYPNGVLFKLDTSGQLTPLYVFPGATMPHGNLSNASPILDSAGNLYGSTPKAGSTGTVYEIEAGGGPKTLYDFGPAYGGTQPDSNLTLDAAGNLYGTTALGGGPQNAGAVYKLSPSGRETVLYTFKGGATDGSSPQTGVVMDSAGNIYGTTPTGGANNQGVIYKLTPTGQETILHTFTGGSDGGAPNGLAIDPAGNLYGTTSAGGYVLGSVGQGVVFKLGTAGNLSVLYGFSGRSDGGEPLAGVVLDAAGNLYGTTVLGGLDAGVVFEIDTTGAYQVLYSFPAGNDTCVPRADLTLDTRGNIYGTCSTGGTLDGGSIFKLDTAGNFSTLCAFSSVAVGSLPLGGVVLDANENLYGTVSATTNSGSCQAGASGACGYVYKIDPSGYKTVVYTFTGGLDGANPVASLTLEGPGHLFGTAAGLLPPPGYGSPAGGGGVVFKITLP